MLYPRMVGNKLVNFEQMVGLREHLMREHRILCLSGVITDEMESCNMLLALDSLSNKTIRLIITSPGGDLDSALFLYDTIRLIRSPVETLGRYCGSAAAMWLAAGSRRYLVPHAKVMLHLPSGQAVGDARDLEIQHKEMEKYKRRIVSILKECGAIRSYEEILADIDRAFWLEPDEAIAYGLADEIMTPEILRKWLE